LGTDFPGRTVRSPEGLSEDGAGFAKTDSGSRPFRRRSRSDRQNGRLPGSGRTPRPQPL